MSICPYPGLRPFTEEESLFFKGRDLHIDQIIAQLEQKKFAMVTGASGDGKSSLIFAGVIPNARAGFFKAKHNNWIFTTFRPERSPLKSFALSLSQQLGMEYKHVYDELSFGFSSLADLYKSSPFYLDQNSESFKESSSEDKVKLKRKAANLFILVDQFEEFFTNPENYNQGQTSEESQTVINLLLETSKIALQQDLPIYIVFTMRSDYVGQCASFRGLPEMIGYSQFFVPRLKRKEIYQVIEDPAKLAGCSISQRLVETLINGMNEGFDQLPVLQHALNGLWNEADKGKELMDLIHLAKITGISPQQLNEFDKKNFFQWKEKLPEYKKKYFNEFGLEKVLNTHADSLYETAYDNCLAGSENANQIITREETQQIIKVVFQCLTRIDASRAVRNRMTLKEITEIIDIPTIGATEVAKAIDSFRIQGNTLISPFKFGINPESDSIEPSTILDITHESLIRNWNRLNAWTKEEYDNLLTWEDFYKQLHRWEENEKSSGYLLPIGPLTFFENWFSVAKPNKFWIARYDNSNASVEDKSKKAEAVLKSAKQFLKQSANRLIVSKTIMKHGAGKIVTAIVLLGLFISCTYFYFDYRKKQNDVVIANIEDRCIDLLSSDKVKLEVKANFIIHYERLHPNSFETILNYLDEDTLAYDIAEKAFWRVNNLEYLSEDSINPLLFPILSYMNDRLQTLVSVDLLKKKTISNGNHSRLNNLLRTCIYINYYQKNEPLVNKIIESNSYRLFDYLSSKLSMPADSINISAVNLNSSLSSLISLSEYNKINDLSEFIKLISPFGSTAASERFHKIFPKDKKVTVDWNNTMSHNGGYQTLSYLYCEAAELDYISQCLDSLFKHNPEYIKYEGQNFFSIYSYLVKFNLFNNVKSQFLIQQFHEHLTGVSRNKINTEIQFNVIHGKPSQWKVTEKKYAGDLSAFTIDYGTKKDIFDYFFTFNESEYVDINQYYFDCAVYYKKRGVFAFENEKNTVESNRFFAKSMEYYKKVNSETLNQSHLLCGLTGGSSKAIKNSELYLYPTVVLENLSWDPFGLSYNHQNFPFLNYIIENRLFHLYSSKTDFLLYEIFLYNLYESNPKNLNESYFSFAETLRQENATASKSISKEFLDLVSILQMFEAGEKDQAIALYKTIDMNVLFSGEFQNKNNQSESVNLLLFRAIASHLAMAGEFDETLKFIYKQANTREIRNSLIKTIYSIQTNNESAIEHTYVYFDSLFVQMQAGNKFGMKLFTCLGLTGTEFGFGLSNKLIKNVNDKVKPVAMANFISGVSYNGLYYKAFTFIPNYISSNNELELYNEILESDVHNKKKILTGWRLLDKEDKNSTSNWYNYESLEDNLILFSE